MPFEDCIGCVVNSSILCYGFLLCDFCCEEILKCGVLIIFKFFVIYGKIIIN